MTPAVSVVIPSRGGRDRLPSLLGCLEDQSREDWEAVVVLDGDIDGSAEVLLPFQDRLPVRVVAFPENRGRAAALNAGFDAATGDVLVRCDDDLAPRPDYIETHAAWHATETCGVIGLVRNLFPETTYARVYGRRWDEEHRREAYAAHADERWRFWAANASVDRETWERIGPYDEGYRAYGWEDVDWGFRLRTAGVPIHLVKELETEHHLAAVTTAGRGVRAYYSGSASRRFEAKHGFDVRTAQRRDPWGLAVSGVSRVLNERTVSAMGRAVDRVADRLPSPVAAKAVALVVEAGSLAGHRRRDAGGAI